MKTKIEDFIKENNNEEEYFLSQDGSSHWVIVPFKYKKEWIEFCKYDEDDERGWELPDWADYVGGDPGNIVFKNYRKI